MGNTITGITSVIGPMITETILVPFVFHPYRWGSVPWEPPSALASGTVSFICNAVMISTIATLAGMMATKRRCNKSDIKQSWLNSWWPVLGYIIAHSVLFLIPFLKVPLLAVFSWMPYANNFATSLTALPIVMIFGAVGNGWNRRTVC